MAIPRGMGMAKGKELKEKYGAKLENWNFQRGDWGGGVVGVNQKSVLS